MAMAVAVYQLSFFAAIRLTGVAVGTVVAIGTGPAAAGALGRLVNGERLTARWAQATALAAAGVVLLAGDGGASVDPAGVALAVTSGVGYAALHGAQQAHARRGRGARRRHGRRLRRRRPAAAARADRSPARASSATPGGLGMAVYLAAVPTALAYVLFSRGLRQLSSGETATLVLAEPLTATALGVVALGEHPVASSPGSVRCSSCAGCSCWRRPLAAGLAVAAVPA